MEIFKRIFDSYVGVLSFGVILFIIGMAIWFYRFFTNKIKEEEKARKK